MEGAKIAVDIRFTYNALGGHVNIVHDSVTGRLTKTVSITNGAAALLLQFVAALLCCC